MGRTRRALAAIVALVATALTVTGCVSMPSAGPVQSYPVTQGPESQNQLYVQIQPQPPRKGWDPQQIVQGFLTASASFGNYSDVAKEYLTPQEQQVWNPFWSAFVYKSGPNVKEQVYTSSKKDTATVQVAGKVQAYLAGNGRYSVPSASAADQPGTSQPSFRLVKLNGQWRIADAPKELLLTSDSFQYDYQPTKLYFFDPADKILVPDPVYVPLQAGGPTDLITGLVNDLISPPKDWLSGGATKTAFPPDTKISGVTIEGPTAYINLTGSIAKASKAELAEVMPQISSQLLWTLVGATQGGQAVKSVAVELNGKLWVPPDAQSNPVQQSRKYNPANGPSKVFYAVDSAGFLTRRASTHASPVRIEHIGTGFAQIAVSPSGKYLAALRGEVLYTAPLGDPLVKRGTGYLAISWDISDQLWATTQNQILMLRGAASPRQPLGQPVPVTVVDPYRLGTGFPYTEIRVAPDGVRVALVSSDGNVLRFGAIDAQEEGLRPGQVSIKITLSQISDAPSSGLYIGLSWYGSDDVITLSDYGPAVTEYSVSGTGTQSIPADTDLETITASYGQPLIGSLLDGQTVELTGPDLNGSWVPIDSGSAPAYPG